MESANALNMAMPARPPRPKRSRLLSLPKARKALPPPRKLSRPMGPGQLPEPHRQERCDSVVLDKAIAVAELGHAMSSPVSRKTMPQEVVTAPSEAQTARSVQMFEALQSTRGPALQSAAGAEPSDRSLLPLAPRPPAPQPQFRFARQPVAPRHADGDGEATIMMALDRPFSAATQGHGSQAPRAPQVVAPPVTISAPMSGAQAYGPGTWIADRYWIRHRLPARRWQSFRAEDRLTGASVAVHLLEMAGGLGGNVKALLKAIARVDSPYACPFVGFTAETNNSYCVVYRRQGICDMETVLRTQGTLSLVPAIDVVVQIAAAIQAAHLVGVKLGRLTVGDVVVCERGHESFEVALASLGLNRVMDLARSFQNVAAPDVDSRVDVAQLGSLLSHLLTGQAGLSQALPQAVLAVVNRAMHRDIHARYASPYQLALDLVALLPKNQRARTGQRLHAIARRVAGARPLPSLVKNGPDVSWVTLPSAPVVVDDANRGHQSNRRRASSIDAFPSFPSFPTIPAMRASSSMLDRIGALSSESNDCDDLAMSLALGRAALVPTSRSSAWSGRMVMFSAIAFMALVLFSGALLVVKKGSTQACRPALSQRLAVMQGHLRRAAKQAKRDQRLAQEKLRTERASKVLATSSKTKAKERNTESTLPRRRAQRRRGRTKRRRRTVRRRQARRSRFIAALSRM